MCPLPSHSSSAEWRRAPIPDPVLVVNRPPSAVLTPLPSEVSAGGYGPSDSDVKPPSPRLRPVVSIGKRPTRAGTLRGRTARWERRRILAPNPHLPLRRANPAPDPDRRSSGAEAVAAAQDAFSASLRETRSSSSSEYDDAALAEQLSFDTSLTDAQRLVRLPRPSTIVPDIALGSRLDAGMSKPHRAAFLRLVSATSLRVCNINREGHPGAVPLATRAYHGLDDYSPFLHAPAGDANIRPARLPRNLLSFYYRDNLLRRRFDRTRKTRRRHRASDAHAYDNQSNLRDEPVVVADAPLSAPSDYIIDFEYWVPSDTFDAAERRRVRRRLRKARKIAEAAVATAAATEAEADAAAEAEVGFETRAAVTTSGIGAVAAVAVQAPAENAPHEQNSTRTNITHPRRGASPVNAILQMSNEDIVKKLLEEAEDDDLSDSGLSSNHSVRANVRNPHTQNEAPSTVPAPSSPPAMDPASAVPPTEPPRVDVVESSDDTLSEEGYAEKPKEVTCTLFDDLLARATENPDSVLHRSDNMRIEKPIVISTTTKETEQNARERSPPNENTMGLDEPKDLSGYDLEVFRAMSYCRRGVKRGKGGRPRSSNKRKWQSVDVVDGTRRDTEQDSANYSKSRRIMEKMGFKKRLGRMEDGVAEPLERARYRTHRVGLGVAPPRVTENDGTEAGKGNGPEWQGLNGAALRGLPGANGNIVGSQRGMTTDDGGEDVEVEVAQKEEKVTVDLVQDGDDVYETGREDEGLDMGRRGMVADLDFLICNAGERRTAAWKSLVDGRPDLVGVDVNAVLRGDGRNLSDWDMGRNLLEKCGVAVTDGLMEEISAALDEAYDVGDAAVGDGDMMRMLRECVAARALRVAVVQRGSGRRLRKEIEMIGMEDVLGEDVSVAMGRDAGEWPYVTQWQEAVCRCGVRATQSLLLSPGSVGGGMTGAVAAAEVLNARSVCVVAADGIGDGNWVQELVGAGTVEVYRSRLVDEGRDGLAKAMREGRGLRKRRRVVAMRAEDQLFHCGVVLVGDGAWDEDAEGRSLVQFEVDGGREWVVNGDMVPLTRKKFRALREGRFPVLLSPDDVDLYGEDMT